ncbi:MAG: NAD-dependent epimerase/dehydratase family protein [bacterium]|nr:NAD-dependent epimerase/dehydratase family protein [bacterium]
MGMKPLDRESGIDIFEKTLAGESGRVIPVVGDSYKIKQVSIFRQNVRDKNGGISSSMPEADENDILYEIENDLLAIVSEILKLSEVGIGVGDDLSEYGFDSITLTELANVINSKYFTDLLPPVLYEHSSIGEIAKYLYKEYGENVVQFYRGSSKMITGTQEVELLQPGFKDYRKRNRFQLLDDQQIEQEGKMLPGEEPIAIIGIGGMLPGAEDLEMFWENLENKKEVLSEIPIERWNWRHYTEDSAGISRGGFIADVDKFDSMFFNISPVEAELMDPQQRILLEIVWKTIEDGGYKASDLSGTNTGVFVGVSNIEYTELLRDNNVEIDAWLATGGSLSIIANRISSFFNFQGTSEAIDTACSSSAVAVHSAKTAIQNGECDQAIAAGVNLLFSPRVFITLNKAGMLSKRGKISSFDKDADGYVRGEGAGAVLLKPLYKAEIDKDTIYAVIKGSAVNHGGRSHSLTAPNPELQSKVIVSAYEKANVEPGTVTYIEAHGTGTSMGDPIEINSFKKAFSTLNQMFNMTVEQKEYCGIGTLKPNIGHLESASGIASLLKMVLALKYKKLPGIVNFEEMNSYIKIKNSPFYFLNETEEWKSLLNQEGKEIPRRAGLHSFGFGGTNTHLIIEEYIVQENENKLEQLSSVECLFIFSARDSERLKEYLEKMKRFIRKSKSFSLCNMAYTLQIGRESMDERLAIIAKTEDELFVILDQCLKNVTNCADGNRIFSGNYKKIKKSTKNKPDQDSVKFISEESDLKKIASLWIEGVDIPWEKLYAGMGVQRIPLPTYQFNRKRHWPYDMHIEESVSVPLEENSHCEPGSSLPAIIEYTGESIEDIQNELIEIISSLLHLEKQELDLDSVFSTYGLTSLAGMKLTNYLRERYGDIISTNAVFKHSSIKKLAQYINTRIENAIENTTAGEPIKEENILQNPSGLSSLLETRKIFITGVTGVIGGSLLKELLESTDSELYCLVRAENIEHGKERIRELLNVYDPEDSLVLELKKRVYPVIGDIVKPDLGLEQSLYEELTACISMVIHVAGKTSLHGLYDQLKAVNVDGTRNIVNFTLKTRQKYIVHVSSYAVMADRMQRLCDPFTEKDFDLGQKFYENMGYQKSKFEAEKIVRSARNNGLKWIIVRPGNVFGDSRNGRYPFGLTGITGVFYNILKTDIEKRFAMNNAVYFDVTPVDYVSKGIIYLGTSLKSIYETYHLINTDYRKFYEIIYLLKDYGFDIELLSPQEYMDRIRKHQFFKDGKEYDSLTTDLIRFNPDLMTPTASSYADASYTKSILENAYIVCPKIDKDLIKTFMDYCFKAGFLTPADKNDDVVPSLIETVIN